MGTRIWGGGAGEEFNRVYVEAVQILLNQTLKGLILKYSNIFYHTQTIPSPAPYPALEIRRAFSLALSIL